ncbi:MAG: hypothetical protein DSY92_04370 [Planctomycetota bacterium]|nr:MAG: hypothetical protein DSY92_04370 [Planctomycetota bacterium]
MCHSARFLLLGLLLASSPCSMVVVASSSPELGSSTAAVSLPDDEKPPTARELKKLIQQAAMSGDAAALAEVLRTVGKLPGREGTAAALSTAASLSSGPDDIYWFLLQGVAGFKGPEAFTEMGEFVLRYKSKPVSRDLLNSLAKCRSKYVNRVIRRVLERGSTDMQLMAVDIAAGVPVRRTVDVLMPVLEREAAKERGGKRPPTPLKLAIISALEALTRQQLGDSLINWQGWWNKAREQGLKVIRDEADDHTPTTGLARPLDPIRARQFLGLEEMPAGSVLVIKGPTAANGNDTNFDHIEEVLERIRIPHQVVEKGELEKPSYQLDGVAAIFVNCTQINKFCGNHNISLGYVGNRMGRCGGPPPHDTVQFKMKQEAIEKLVKWVEKGGYLFTEDWVLVELLEIGFSRYVRSGSPLEEAEVSIHPERGMTAHPMLRGVFIAPVDLDALRRERWAGYDDDEDDEEDDEYDPTVEDDPGDVDRERGKTAVGDGEAAIEPSEIEDPDIRLIDHRWKIDKESPSLSIQSKKVQVLVESEQLRKICGEGAVAITFPVGRGRVLHVLSHFGKQSSSDNEATIENILVNFLLQVRIRASGTR